MLRALLPDRATCVTRVLCRESKPPAGPPGPPSQSREAVDGRLPRDLEKRHGSGEKGIYTQRLHDSRGKRHVKTLTARYAEERLLRSRINGYIRLFERLMDTLAELPGGSATIDEVLASQSGEVYLMLAEVSGRVQNP